MLSSLLHYLVKYCQKITVSYACVLVKSEYFWTPNAWL